MAGAWHYPQNITGWFPICAAFIFPGIIAARPRARALHFYRRLKLNPKPGCRRCFVHNRFSRSLAESWSARHTAIPHPARDRFHPPNLTVEFSRVSSRRLGSVRRHLNRAGALLFSIHPSASSNLDTIWRGAMPLRELLWHNLIFISFFPLFSPMPHWTSKVQLGIFFDTNIWGKKQEKKIGVDSCNHHPSRNSVMEVSNATLTGTGNDSAAVYDTAVRLTLAGLTLLLLITSAAANLLIIIALLRFKKLRTNFNYYLLNMSVSDFSLALFAMSHFFVFMWHGRYPFGYAGCTAWLYCDWLFSAATENTMMLVSLDRMVSVYRPIAYRNWQKKWPRYSLPVLGMMWLWLNGVVLGSLLLTRLLLPDGGVELDEQGRGLCLIDYSVHQDVITTSVLLLFWLPEAVTVLSYILIAVKMRQKFVAGGGGGGATAAGRKNSKDIQIVHSAEKGIPFLLNKRKLWEKTL